ncbi:MAG: sulfatase-like hydrolase/transferase [Anaerolineae bacterium]|nr:sulfatase-like hydrolase/transferase [Anaerolineae bacterium]
MKDKLERRDFLKLSALAAAGSYATLFEKQAVRLAGSASGENILIVVFDTLSAKHLSLYGYQRNTTPNIERIAQRGIVYHEHYAGGPYTTPGTASLLTGTYPWTHRAFRVQSQVAKEFENKNIFSLFEDYHRIAYTHNPVANTFLRQFLSSLDTYIPRQDLFLLEDYVLEKLLINDYDTASIFKRQLYVQNDGDFYSLFLPNLLRKTDRFERQKRYLEKKYAEEFPRGLPGELNHFILEDGINAMQGTLPSLDSPYLAYYHFFPPHAPYTTRRDFYDAYNNDGYEPVKKPEHLFSRKISWKNLVKNRRAYDEFILYVDHEFGRLYDYLESSGHLDNTWVIFTSDHGELFERGIKGHFTESLHQPVVNVPLIILPPGQTKRVDVYDNTSCVDLIPTLLNIANRDIPEWLEGELLPPYGPVIPNREIYALQARHEPMSQPIKAATAMLVKNEFKLTKYFGYAKVKREVKGDGLYELYNIHDDPEELNNLYESMPDVAGELTEILNNRIEKENAPYLPRK